MCGRMREHAVYGRTRTRAYSASVRVQYVCSACAVHVRGRLGHLQPRDGGVGLLAHLPLGVEAHAHRRVHLLRDVQAAPLHLLHAARHLLAHGLGGAR